MSDEVVLSFADALNTVLSHARSAASGKGNLAVETVPLTAAAGRVLATIVTAERDQPPFDRSTRDGYAIRTADIAEATRTLHLVGSIRAGEQWSGPALASGQAIEIMTGAPLPAGADAVVMLEHVQAATGSITLAEGRNLSPGENVVPRAAEARTGDSLLPTGRVLNAAEIAVAASCGRSTLEVFAQPTVAIVATGDELVELATQPEPWQIRNSNSYALAALVAAEGGSPNRLPIAPDTLADLRDRIAKGRESDLLLLSGGVSMGKYDLVEQVLRESGAEFFLTGALIQPGKPIVFGRLPKPGGTHTYFFGLPGNPVSTQVCFHLFVAPILRALAGRTDLAPHFVAATLSADVKGGARVTRFLPAELEAAWDKVTVQVVGWQGSGDVAANARGNCYCVLPADVSAFHAGETVRVLLR
ncbi:MAG: gephyrin-like molybdotransferase Glp [Acidobacteriota bacterium]